MRQTSFLRAATAAAMTAALASTRIARAHHGIDLGEELPLWQFLIVGALVVLGFVAAAILKKRFERHRKRLDTARH